MAFRVRIEPLGEDILVEEGETLMNAARRHGLRWPTICEGNAECGVCVCEITAGDTNVPPRSPRECEGLKAAPPSRARTGRLACQLTFFGDATVFKKAVRREH